ncbi:hypothetical protein D3C71_1781080 [compost metagenome]
MHHGGVAKESGDARIVLLSQCAPENGDQVAVQHNSEKMAVENIPLVDFHAHRFLIKTKNLLSIVSLHPFLQIDCEELVGAFHIDGKIGRLDI